MLCGICSTDLDRRFLPFPLPQIIGHEVVAEDPSNGSLCSVEINDTCLARGQVCPEIFCQSGLPTHCPGRMVLGIDRLPGGFGQWILAPRNAIIAINDIPQRTAVLAEPLAAALNAVAVSVPGPGDNVAVMGVGRLGALIIASLAAQRAESGKIFTITAVIRDSRRIELAESLGSDCIINLSEKTPQSLHEAFHIVYEATGTPEGLDAAMEMSLREVHLKSTHGRECCGMRHLTELVVDELNILPFTEENLAAQRQDKGDTRVFVPEGSPPLSMPDRVSVFRGGYREAEEFLSSGLFHGRIPRFDTAVAFTAEETDFIIRPNPRHENPLIRPRGTILLAGKGGANPLMKFIASGKILRSSRCGDLRSALSLLRRNRATATALERSMITEEFPAGNIPAAFRRARSSDAIKVVVRH